MALQVVVVTPEKTTLDQTCEFVALPMFDGETGVMPGHAAVIGRLKAGELRVNQGGQTSRYYVDGGFVQIANDVVSVLTGRSVAAEKIDLAEAQNALEEAEKLPSHTAPLMEIKTKAVQQAKALLSLAETSR